MPYTASLVVLYATASLFFSVAALKASIEDGVPDRYAAFNFMKVLIAWPFFIVWFGLRDVLDTTLQVYLRNRP